jgi:hypothetical protein
VERTLIVEGNVDNIDEALTMVAQVLDSNDYALDPGWRIEIVCVVDDDGRESIDVSIQGTLKEEAP